MHKNHPGKKYFELFTASLKLGLTSFGGPIAHLGYFHDEYVVKRKWLDEQSYADLVALCQFLPGPASSQLGIGIGTIRAGLLGGIIAWFGFTAPSAIALVLFAFLLKGSDFSDAGWLHGLKIVAVAIVAQAILIMWQKLITDRKCASIALFSMVILLFWQTAFSQVIVIIFAGLIGLVLYRNAVMSENSSMEMPVSRTLGGVCLIAFFILLVILPVFRHSTNSHWIAIADSFYRSGALVFGGGHVVLPLLEKEVVPVGWIRKADFLAGYGAAQAVPGPLFTFAAYLGAMIDGIFGALLSVVAIFLPAFLLIIGALPFWNDLRRNTKIKGALIGINAAVVGILLAALYNPLCISSILKATDLGLAVCLFGMLVFWKMPPWIVVIAGAAGNSLVGMLGL
jgi:chromate transporter